MIKSFLKKLPKITFLKDFGAVYISTIVYQILDIIPDTCRRGQG